MADKYDSWAADAPRWLEGLTRSLDHAVAKGGKDLLVGYGEVALAFPSRRPHENSFDFPAIDADALKAWAKANGWTVATAPEAKSPDALSGQPPPIRFRKMLRT
jgi:hypothetical protein